MKTNLVMNDCFHTDEMFQLERVTICREPIHSLIVQFLLLQATCVYNLVCDLFETRAHFSS